jgi:hypothetical protein
MTVIEDVVILMVVFLGAFGGMIAFGRWYRKRKGEWDF